MVHAAVGYARMKDRLQAFACTSSIGPGATNMVTGAALATVNRIPVLLLPGDVFADQGGQPAAAGTRGPAHPGRVGERLPAPGVAVLRPHLAARAASRRPAAGHAGADRPGRDRGGDDRAPPGHRGRGVRLAAGAVRRPGVAHPAAAPRAAGPGRGGGGDPPVAAAAAGGRRRRALQRRHRGAARPRGADRHPGRRDPGRQRRAALRPPGGARRDRRHRNHGRQRHRARGGPRHRRRHPVERLHHGLQQPVPAGAPTTST